jgi:hypothetical protein
MYSCLEFNATCATGPRDRKNGSAFRSLWVKELGSNLKPSVHRRSGRPDQRLQSIAMAVQVEQIASLEPLRVCTPVLCPLGFIHGYRCASCSWALLFPDCHVAWAVPFCYQMQAKSGFDSHDCRDRFVQTTPPSCRLCREPQPGVGQGTSQQGSKR